MQIDSRSSRLGNPQLLHPFGDDRRAVVRAWARLGMELRRARAQLRVVEPLDRAVVERDRRHAAGAAQGDGVALVLRGDEHSAAAAIEYRVIRTAVAERKLER